MVREPVSWKEILDFRLVTIAGSPVTPGSVCVAAAILFCTLALAALLGRSARKILKVRGVSVGVQFAAAKMVRYTVVFLGLIIAFNAMGLRLDALLAASAVVAVGIGLGLQNVAQNFISGLILLVEQPVRQGDFIRVGDALGVVSDIGLRATMIVTRDQVTIIVPNGQLITGAVVNHSRPTLEPAHQREGGRGLRDRPGTGARHVDEGRRRLPRGPRPSRARGSSRGFRRQLAQLRPPRLDLGSAGGPAGLVGAPLRHRRGLPRGEHRDSVSPARRARALAPGQRGRACDAPRDRAFVTERARILLHGATGFTGRLVARELLARGLVGPSVAFPPAAALAPGAALGLIVTSDVVDGAS